MFRYSIIAVLMFSMSLLIIPHDSFSQGNQAEINTLKGIKGIGLSVEDIDADAAADGLSKDKLLKVITQKLKKSGIKVFTDLELRTISGQPQLVLNINSIKQPGPIYIFTTTLDLTQIVLLERNKGLTAVSPTWTVLTTGGSLPEDLAATVDASIDPMLESFITDYKKANP
ncbi:MAG: hypothetical protein DHS20C13_24580 [Thermodesulfobacteriota bacterium]|nr:MAG: hypothetical protein DHS20C13_24580 [Thermodesulfobacteriota bacterium]